MQADQFAAAIQAHPTLGWLSQQDRARLLAAAEPCSYSAGDPIYQAGQSAQYCYWLLVGQVELVRPSTPVLLEADQVFGGEAFADQLSQPGTYLTDALALTDVQVLRVSRSILGGLATRHPGLKSAALMGLAARLGGLPLPESPPQSTPMVKSLPLKQRIGWPAALALPPVVWWLADQAGLPPQGAVYLGLFSLMSLMWLFALVDEFIPPILAVVAMLFIDLVPPQVALRGFYSRTFLLLLGVYALAAVVVSSGLAYRLMLWVLVRLPDSPFWHRTALTLFGFLLSIVMPSSNARLTLLLPLYQEMDQSLKAPAQGPQASALMISVFTGATLFSPLLLTAKSSNLAAFTMLPSQVRSEFQGIEWLVGAAVVAFGLFAAHLLAMRFLFRVETHHPLPADRIRAQITLLGPLRPPEWVAAIAFLVFLLGAIIPQWHQSQAAWLAGLVLVGLLLLGLFNKGSFKTQIDWPLIFFLLSLDGLMEAMQYLNLDDLMIQAIGGGLAWVDGSLGWFILLALMVTVALRLVLPLTAGMILAVTILLPVGLSQGIHPWLVVFLASLFSDIWFMPHQNSALQQAMSAGLRSRCNETLFFHYAWWLNPLRIVLAYASIPYWQWLGLH
ncbi:SLC13 family permease [Castellaniella sp.]|uniref:SLC13 family permease n=1 Tax=Castellaniella sp. TaxID=1955812 RepID=UPI002B00249B|nr:SLC13 family permease [Castellaniella sp.]